MLILVPAPVLRVIGCACFCFVLKPLCVLYEIVKCPHLQFERVCVIGTGGEVGVDQSSPTEGSPIRQLVLLPVLGLHTLSVAVGGVGGAHCLTTWKPHKV